MQDFVHNSNLHLKKFRCNWWDPKSNYVSYSTMNCNLTQELRDWHNLNIPEYLHSKKSYSSLLDKQLKVKSFLQVFCLWTYYSKAQYWRRLILPLNHYCHTLWIDLNLTRRIIERRRADLYSCLRLIVEGTALIR